MSEDFEEEIAGVTYEENFEPDEYEDDITDEEIEEIMNKTSWVCIICGNEFETENELDYHARVHNIFIRRTHQLSVEFR